MGSTFASTASTTAGTLRSHIHRTYACSLSILLSHSLTFTISLLTNSFILTLSVFLFYFILLLLLCHVLRCTVLCINCSTQNVMFVFIYTTVRVLQYAYLSFTLFTLLFLLLFHFLSFLIPISILVIIHGKRKTLIREITSPNFCVNWFLYLGTKVAAIQAPNFKVAKHEYVGKTVRITSGENNGNQIQPILIKLNLINWVAVIRWDGFCNKNTIDKKCIYHTSYLSTLTWFLLLVFFILQD